MRFPLLFSVLIFLIASACASTSGPKSAARGKPEFRTISGQLVKADSGQPLAKLRIAVGNSADARSLFGLVEHHLFGKGRTDAQGHFAITIPETPEFKKADDEKTLLIVVFGNRDYLGVALTQGAIPIYPVPKVVVPQ
jgi:hypothetical protein